MAIDKTTRKVSVTSNGRSNEALTALLECENTSDIEVYGSNGTKYRNGVDYNVSNNTIPGVTANSITITWVGNSPSDTLSVYRTSTRTQTVDLGNAFTNDLLEDAFDKMTLASQNTLSTTNSVLDLDDDKIQVMGDPINDSDASTLGYMQAEYSKGGYICPPITTVDAGLTGTGKVLYSQSTTSVIWKDPFDVPYPTANSKVLQLNGLGVPTWVSPPDYAPAYPTTQPMYLGVGSSAKAWVAMSQMPTLTKGVVGDTLVFQHDSKAAWMPIRWLSDDMPGGSHSSEWPSRYLYNSTGTGVDGAVGSVTTTLIAAAKATSIRENDTDRNQGGTWDCWCKGDIDNNRVPLLEFDCSALSASTHTMDTLESCYLKVYFTSASASASRTFVIRRLKNTFVEGTGASGNSYNDDGATWEKPTAPGGSPDWNWGGGNFNPLYELDYELPAPTFLVGSDTVTGQFTYIDIKELFLDAIRNRSGILRLAMYDPAATTSSRSSRFYANGGDANDIKVEVKNAPARRAYWQPWNYHLIRTPANTLDEPCSQSLHYYKTNPHWAASPQPNQYATSDIKGGHMESLQGKTVASAFSVMQSNYNQYYYNMGWPTASIKPDGEGVTHVLDITNGSGPSDEYQGTDANQINAQIHLRTATIWMEDE